MDETDSETTYSAETDSDEADDDETDIVDPDSETTYSDETDSDEADNDVLCRKFSAVTDGSEPEIIAPKKKAILGNNRLTKYSTNWQNDCNWLCTVTSDEYKAYCKLCEEEFTISHGGFDDVVKHSKSRIHSEIASFRAAKNLNSYFQAPGTSTSATSDCDLDDNIMYKKSAAEITSVYHTVKHSLSYESMDCFQKLLPLMYTDFKIAKNVKLPRTKSEAIVCDVLAKEALKAAFEHLKEDIFFSISTDVRNYKRKIFPICVRYFSFDKGMQNKLIDIVESENRTAYQVTKTLCETLDRNNLKLSQLTSYGARYSNHSVFQNLLAKNEKILKVNCSIHILHDMSKFACDRLDIDVKAIIININEDFSKSPTSRAELMKIFQTTETEWGELLRHVNTRFLSLYLAVERVIKVWPALRRYFCSQEPNSEAIVYIFSSKEDETKILAYLHFVHDVLSAFDVLSMKESQGNDIVITEMHESLCLFRSRLTQMRKEEFFGYQTKQILKKLHTWERICSIRDFKFFYNNCKQYLDKRYNFSDENIFSRLKFMNMESEVFFDMIKNAVSLLKFTSDISLDNLYEEFNLLKPAMDVLVKHCKVTTSTTAQKWHQLFQQFPKKDTSNMFKLVSFILSIPTSNSFPERVYSQMYLKLPDARNEHCTNLMKAELLIQFNLELSCAEFFNFIKEKKETLEEVISLQKYEMNK